MAAASIAVLSSFDSKGIDAAQKELDKLKAASTGATNSMMDGFKKASEKMMSLGKSLTVGVTLPLVGAGVIAGKWASDAAESANKVNVVFGEQAKTVLAWAKDSERAFGLSEGQANSFFGSIGTMLQGFGLDMAVVPDMSKQILGLAADLGSFHNIDTATVMDMISASFRGEYDSIQRVIPTINSAAVATEALTMTGKKSADELTEQEKALATYQLMLKGAGPAAGDFARTQDGAANSTRIAQAQIRSAGEAIGSVFMPIVASVSAKVAEWADKFANLDDGTKKIIVVVAAAAAALGPLLMAAGALSKAIIAINGAMTLLAANPIVLAIIGIVAAIAALVAAAIYAYNNFEWFRTAVDATWDAIQTAISWAWESVIQPVFTAIVSWVQQSLIPWMQSMWEVMKKVWAGIATAVTWAWNNVIKPAWDTIYWYITTILIPYYTLLWNAAKAVFEKIAGIVSWAWNNVIKPAWDAISWYLTTILIPYLQLVWDFWSDVFNDIAAIVSWAWDNVIKPIWDLLAWYIGNILVPLFTAIWNVVSTVFNAVAATISWVWNSIISPVFNWISGAIGTLIAVFGTIKDGIASAFSTIFDVITSPFKTAFNAVAGFWNNTVGSLSFSVPSWVPGLGGKGFSMPKIPTFATGGIFEAPVPGGAGLAMLHDGEMILNAAQQAAVFGGRSGAATNYQIVVNVGPTSDKASVGLAVVEAIKSYERNAGIGWRK